MPGVACWIDTRSGYPRAFTATIKRTRGATFETWRKLRWGTNDLANLAISGPAADPDGDGIPNFAEILHESVAADEKQQAPSGQNPQNVPDQVTPAEKERVFRSVLAYDEVEGSLGDVLGRFVNFVDAAIAIDAAFAGAKPISRWCSLMQGLMSSFFEPRHTSY